MSNKEKLEEIQKKIMNLGDALGFKVEKEWSPESLKKESRQDVYIPKIDVVWYKEMDEKFSNFLENIRDKMMNKMNKKGSFKNYLANILPRYRDPKIEIVIGFELELTDRPTKYILGDITNLSRMCDYGFIVITKRENLVKRSIKATIAFSLLHGASKVFVIDVDDLDDIIKETLKNND